LVSIGGCRESKVVLPPAAQFGNKGRREPVASRSNKTRAECAEKFERLIESHNSGSRNVEEFVKLNRDLSEEQRRHVRENMSAEELVMFDFLTRPAPELSTEERAEVNEVARELLKRIKLLLVLNLRQKSTARSQRNASQLETAVLGRAFRS
jgi:hypothetical protein